MVDEKNQMPTYEPIGGADFDQTSLALQLRALIDVLVARGIVSRANLEDALDGMMAAQRAACPHDGRDEAHAARSKEP